MAKAFRHYGYDAYGNMVRDDNKGISSISYNHLHLPVKIVMAGGNIEYLYDGAGAKLKKTVTEPGRPVKTQDYLSGFTAMTSWSYSRQRKAM